jgi:hypothetical protein
VNDAARRVGALLIALPVLGGYVALQVRHARAVRAKREWYRQHPEKFPSRRQRVLRILPFALILAVGTIFFAAIGRSESVPLGVIGVACFAFLIYRIASGRDDVDSS